MGGGETSVGEGAGKKVLRGICCGWILASEIQRDFEKFLLMTLY